VMKMLKLRERKSEARGKIRKKARPAARSGEEAALPLSLIDTQTLRTMRVEVDSRQIAAVRKPAPIRAGAAEKPSGLTLEPVEADTGYDPYNNFGEAVARRPRAAVGGSRH
ncbi:MAG: hypothetical protein AAFN78_06755, partial [Pseudomonadota bacterium]